MALLFLCLVIDFHFVKYTDFFDGKFDSADFEDVSFLNFIILS